jgi:hypothetical protein
VIIVCYRGLKPLNTLGFPQLCDGAALTIAVGDSVLVDKPVPSPDIVQRHLTASLTVGDDVGKVVSPPPEAELPPGDVAVWFPEKEILLSLPAENLTPLNPE